MSGLSGCLSAALLCALLCPSNLVGQNADVSETGGMADESGAPKAVAGAAKPQYLYRAGAVVEITTNLDQTQSERVVPAAELKDLRSRNLIPKIHAANLFTATASIRPRQLAPGETGTLHVLVTLSANTVVLPTSKVSLRVFSDTLPVKLGASRVVPASQGALPGHFHGTPVHDNIVEIRTPVTIESGAKMKSYPIAGHVEIEVHNGTTGRRIGEFYSGIDGWLKVGRSLSTAARAVPRPAGRSILRVADAGGVSSPGPSSGDIMSGDNKVGGEGSSAPGRPTRRQRPGSGSKSKAVPESTPNDGRGWAGSIPAVSNLLLFGLGSAALFGLIFVLLRRRRDQLRS